MSSQDLFQGDNSILVDKADDNRYPLILNDFPSPTEMLHKYGPEAVHIFGVALCDVAMEDVNSALLDADNVNI